MPLWISLENGRTITLEQVVTLSSLRLMFPEMRWGFNRCGCCVHAHVFEGAFLIGDDGEWDFYPRGVVPGDR